MKWQQTERLRMWAKWGCGRWGKNGLAGVTKGIYYWLDGNGSDLHLVRTRCEKEWKGGGKGDWFPLRRQYWCRRLRDQGQRGLHIFLLDTTRTAQTGAIYPTGRGLLVVVMVMVLLLWW